MNGAPNATLSGSLQVTEESRKFVADLLAKLRDQLIVDLFTAAQIDKLGDASLQEWVDGFKTKIKRDVLDSRCG